MGKGTRRKGCWERWDKPPAISDRNRIKTDADYGEELFFTK